MNVDTAYENLKRANPAPHPNELATPTDDQIARWIEDMERTRNMAVNVDVRRESDRPIPPSRNWVGVAAVIVLALGLIIALRAATREVPPAERTPIETAELFMTEMSQLDVEGTSALFADNVNLDPFPQDWPGMLEWYEASDWKHTPGRCSEVTAFRTEDDPVTIYCEYLPTNAWSRALGHDVTSPDRFRLTVQDGLIVRLENQDVATPADASFLPAWTAFIEWVEETRPEDLEIMFEEGMFEEGEISLTDASIALWAENTEDFVASVSE